MFNIKLKTKNGHDVKKKETFTVFFRTNYKIHKLTNKKTAEFTYRIFFSKGVVDPGVVLGLKNADGVKSREDLMIKTMLNLCHILGKLSVKFNIDPDFILFISTDFSPKTSMTWSFCKDLFARTKLNKNKAPIINTKWAAVIENQFTSNYCKQYGVVRDEVFMLKDFIEKNTNTTFMDIDPMLDQKKYEKSLKICDELGDRIDRKLEITQASISEPKNT